MLSSCVVTKPCALFGSEHIGNERAHRRRNVSVIESQRRANSSFSEWLRGHVSIQVTLL